MKGPQLARAQKSGTGLIFVQARLLAMNVFFGQNTFVGNSVKIGNNVKIQNNVSIYDKVLLEDGVFVGQVWFLPML